MNSILRYLLLPAFLISGIFAQTPSDYSVQVSVTAQTAPPVLNFSWPPSATATAYNVFRKLKTQTFWTLVTNLPGSAAGYTDNTLVVGDAFEYMFERTEPAYTAYGLIFAGIEAPLTEFRGKIIVVVDTTVLPSLQAEYDTYLLDLVGDGYEVVEIRVDRSDAVPAVKNLIVNAYLADPTNVQTLALFGRVPVPYSGDLAPDGHIPDHQGAWPADVFYGELDGFWNDVTINNTGATRVQNQNVPGDGKYDETSLPSDVELMIGRMDLSNMNAFTLSETALLRQYLNNNHEWRHRQYRVNYRGLIDDNFGTLGGVEPFAANGWRNFAPLVNSWNVTAGNIIPDLYTNDYLLSYGCGPGSYTSSGSVGVTNDFVADTVHTVFTSLFGSYFGDWDSDNNFLRAPLASGRALASFWAGRPHWYIHHMGLGESVGYGARLTQNNNVLYYQGFGPRYVHIALMGDPSLRMFLVTPPSSLISTAQNFQNEVLLSWNAPTDPANGYHVYRATSQLGPYTRINANLVVPTVFIDTAPPSGTVWYMVRAVKLDTTASGTFWNSSQGIYSSITLNPALTCGIVTPVQVCPGDTLSIPYQVLGPFAGNNVFTAELSDATGSFAAPVSLGTIGGRQPDTFNIVIPMGTLAGTQYRVRVNGILPGIVTGSDNGVDLTVLATPAAPIANNSGPVCPGDSLFLSTPVNGATYQWTGPNGFTDIVQNPMIPIVGPTIAGTYSLVVTSGTCPSMPGTTVVLYNVPVPVSVSTNSPVCVGDSLFFTSTAIPNSSYTWSGPAGQSLSIANPHLKAFLPLSGTWTLNITQAGCNVGAATVPVVINPLPAAPVVTYSSNLLNSSYPNGNQWYYNNQILAGATLQQHTPNYTGAYYVSYTDPNGCVAYSQTQLVYLTGLDAENTNSIIGSVYPNPTQDKFWVTVSNSAYTNSLILTDALGRVWKLNSTDNGAYEVGGLSSGIYTIQLEGGESLPGKLLINR